MHMQTVLVDTSWLHNVWEMFLLFIKFKFLWKNGVSEKIKVHLPQPSSPSTSAVFQPPNFKFYSKKLLAPPPFKKEGRDYAFYMRDYKELTKETPFYITDNMNFITSSSVSSQDFPGTLILIFADCFWRTLFVAQKMYISEYVCKTCLNELGIC